MGIKWVFKKEIEGKKLEELAKAFGVDLTIFETKNPQEKLTRVYAKVDSKTKDEGVEVAARFMGVYAFYPEGILINVEEESAHMPRPSLMYEKFIEKKIMVPYNRLRGFW